MGFIHGVVVPASRERTRYDDCDETAADVFCFESYHRGTARCGATVTGNTSHAWNMDRSERARKHTYQMVLNAPALVTLSTCRSAMRTAAVLVVSQAAGQNQTQTIRIAFDGVASCPGGRGGGSVVTVTLGAGSHDIFVGSRTDMGAYTLDIACASAPSISPTATSPASSPMPAPSIRSISPAANPLTTSPSSTPAPSSSAPSNASPSAQGDLVCGATVQGDTTGAADAGHHASGEHFWQFTVTATTEVEFDTCGSNFDTYLRIFNGTSTQGPQLAADDDGCQQGNFNSRLHHVFEPGLYTVLLEGYLGNEGRYELSVVCRPLPSFAPTSLPTRSNPAFHPTSIEPMAAPTASGPTRVPTVSPPGSSSTTMPVPGRAVTVPSTFVNQTESNSDGSTDGSGSDLLVPAVACVVGVAFGALVVVMITRLRRRTWGKRPPPKAIVSVVGELASGIKWRSDPHDAHMYTEIDQPPANRWTPPSDEESQGNNFQRPYDDVRDRSDVVLVSPNYVQTTPTNSPSKKAPTYDSPVSPPKYAAPLVYHEPAADYASVQYAPLSNDNAIYDSVDDGYGIVLAATPPPMPGPPRMPKPANGLGSPEQKNVTNTISPKFYNAAFTKDGDEHTYEYNELPGPNLEQQQQQDDRQHLYEYSEVVGNM